MLQHIFVRPNFLVPKYLFYTTTPLYIVTFEIYILSY